MKKKEKNPKDKEIENYKQADLIQIYIDSLQFQQINFPLLLCYLKNALLQKTVEIHKKFSINLFGQIRQCQITKINPEQKEAQIFKVTNKTNITLAEQINQIKKQRFDTTENNAIKLYGMDKQVKELEVSILKSIYDKTKLQQIGLTRIKGVLILGISGMGKTALVKYIKYKLKDINFKIYQSFNLLSRVVGGSEQLVKKIFEESKAKQPSVIIFEDLHLLFQKKKNENETILSALLAQMQNLKEQEQVMVIGTSNLDRELDNNIKRAGRFEKQIILQLPKHKQREAIIKGIISKIPNQLTDIQIHQINLKLNGFSNGQIKQIIRQAYLINQDLNKVSIQTTLKNFRPSGIKQLLTQVPEVKWDQIGGYEDVKLQIKKVIQWPLIYPNLYKNLGIEPMKGILLYGPPGCSKTMMAKAIATQSKLNFLAVKGPELFSKYVGQSQKAVRNIFKRARACSPCVIFFDEIDAIATQRSINTDVSQRVLCQLLNEMDGIEGLKEVTIVAATNRPNILDKALMRPGRLDHLIYIPPPDYQARKQIFRINFARMKLAEDINIVSELLAKQTENYSGAQICLICREGALLALSENLKIETIQTKYFLKAKSKIKYRLTPQIIQEYKSYADNLKFF